MGNIDSLVLRKMPGRLRKLRLREKGENSGTRLSKRGRNMRCKKCFHQGHNSISCPNKNNDVSLVLSILNI
ncbi:hypothetical protein REPUB_Repub04eG0100500 [Reevesia pubescens]